MLFGFSRLGALMISKPQPGASASAHKPFQAAIVHANLMLVRLEVENAWTPC